MYRLREIECIKKLKKLWSLLCKCDRSWHIVSRRRVYDHISVAVTHVCDTRWHHSPTCLHTSHFDVKELVSRAISMAFFALCESYLRATWRI